MFSLGNKIGVTGFEPATSWSQTRRSTKLSYTPSFLDSLTICQSALLAKTAQPVAAATALPSSPERIRRGGLSYTPSFLDSLTICQSALLAKTAQRVAAATALPSSPERSRRG